MKGLLIGGAAFLVIGLCHPLVVKAEYYTGVRLWWLFLLGSLGCLAACFFVDDILAEAILGVAGFSLLWSIGELFAQHKRVERGWFPAGPGHRSSSSGPQKS